MHTKHGLPFLHTSSGSVASNKSIVYTILLAAAGSNTNVILHNNTTGSGEPALRVNALANTSELVDFSYLGGVPFPNGMYVTITSGSAFVWRE